VSVASARVRSAKAAVRSRLEPHARRAPATPEGRAIVAAILDATERLLVERGFDRCTTNGIAEFAGVSVGSFYQYFSSKEAAVAAVGRRVREQQRELVARTIAARPERPVEEVVAAVVTELVGSAASRKQQRKALLREVPPSWVEGDGEPETWDGVRELLERRGAEVRRSKPAVMAFVVYHAASSVIDAALAQRDELLDDPAFVAELAALVARYVRARR
jgi:AcrR family transcriptional regulator